MVEDPHALGQLGGDRPNGVTYVQKLVKNGNDEINLNAGRPVR